MKETGLFVCPFDVGIRVHKQRRKLRDSLYMHVERHNPPDSVIMYHTL